MNAASRLKETLYLELSAQSVYPLIPVGRCVPAVWAQTFTTLTADQRTFDLHLLRGLSDQVTENSTVGKWRIAGIPPAPQGQQRVDVKVRVGVDGSVGLAATLKEQALSVIFLTEAFPQIPLTSQVPAIPAENHVRQPCPACQGQYVLRAANWKHEGFALCLDCGHEFELPVTAVMDEPPPWQDLPSELMETLGLELPHAPGGLSDADIRELQEKGFDLNPHSDTDLVIDANKIIKQIPGMIFGRSKTKIELDHEEILRLAGDPLPADERRNCPKCDAVISRAAQRCEWCGQVL